MDHDRSTSRRKERRDQRPARRHLSAIQQRMLIWLQDERQRTDTPDGIPFPTLVQAMKTDKLNVMTSLRQLMRKGLVAVTLPRGSWTRYIDLTPQGMDQARDLTKQTSQAELPDKRPRSDKRERDLRKRDRKNRLRF